MELREFEKSYRLRFSNGISVEILKRDRDYAGLGQVKWRRRKLRSAELPVMPLIRTPDGYEVSRLRFQDVRKGRGETLTLDLIPHVRRHGRMEWVCCDGQDRWNVGPWDEKETRDRGGAVRIVLQPVNRMLGGLEFAGFSYSYKFRSRKHRIYRIHDRASWELGGRATGNSFWMAGPLNEPQKTFTSKADTYTTAWCRGEQGGLPIQQFLPYFALLQGFTFQFDAQSVLVTTFESPFHCLSLFQKDAGQNHIVHWHQLCGDLSGSVEFPAQQVLVADPPDGLPTQRADRYCAIRDELQRACCEQVGAVREPAVTSGWLPADDGCRPAALQRGIDVLARAGCARVYVPGLFRQLGPDGPDGKAAIESHQRVRRVVEHARHRGTQVAASLADCSVPWAVAAAPGDDPQQEAPPLQADSGGEVLARALRSAADGRLLREHLRRVRKDVGIDALFADGILLSLADQFDWGPAQQDEGRGAGCADGDGGTIRSLFGSWTALVADLARMGYRYLPAGAAGLGGPMRSPPYAALKGREYMFRDSVLEFPADALTEQDADPVRIYFRACANRLCYALPYDVDGQAKKRLAGWWHADACAINHAYQAVREHMEQSHLLPEDRGVLWTGADPEVRVLWCCQPFAWSVGEQAEVFDVMASRCVEVADGAFTPQAVCVYLVQNADEM